MRDIVWLLQSNVILFAICTADFLIFQSFGNLILDTNYFFSNILT